MHRSHSWSKFVAAALLVAMPPFGLPVAAAGGDTGLAGVVISSADRSPLVGARVHASDSASGSVFSSAASDRDGRFRLDSLPASSYEIAVEVDGGLYLVGSRVALAPGQTRDIDVAIDDRQPATRVDAQTAGGVSKSVSAWNNPATAALIVLGSAFVVGAIVENAIDDDEDSMIPASKFQPN